MDLKASKALLKQEKQLEAYLIYLDDQQQVQEYMTEGFQKRMPND